MTRKEIESLSQKELRDGYRDYLLKGGRYSPSTIKVSSYSALFLLRHSSAMVFWSVIYSSDAIFRDMAKKELRKALSASDASWNDEHSVISRLFHLASFRDYILSITE